ncbi:MAG: hypothetical protein HY870_17185 [Chloroflexi bacterium]|nr:hypothetical protein [Chloroflexota bacterium]
MTESTQDKKPLLKRILQFDRIATIVGFIVDVITLASLILALNLNPLTLPRFLSPGLALGIWVIACYTYLAYVHYYWEKNRKQKRFRNQFSQFLLRDLIREFRSPAALFPAIVLAVLFVAVLSLDTALSTIALIAGIVLCIVGPFALAIRSDSDTDEKKAKRFAEENWAFVKKRVKQELSTKAWIDCNDLSDIALTWKVDNRAMQYVLAKYAAENALSTRYGGVYKKGDDGKGTLVSGSAKVLINLQNLDRTKFFY